METFSALLAICAGNSSVSGEFPAQRPVTRSFDVVFDLRLDGRLSKQSWGWWLESPSCPLWRQGYGGGYTERPSLLADILNGFTFLWLRLQPTLLTVKSDHVLQRNTKEWTLTELPIRKIAFVQ